MILKICDFLMGWILKKRELTKEEQRQLKLDEYLRNQYEQPPTK